MAIPDSDCNILF